MDDYSKNCLFPLFDNLLTDCVIIVYNLISGTVMIEKTYVIFGYLRKAMLTS